MELRILTTVGTRPEIIKMAPIIEALNKRDSMDMVLVHTGQHYDWNMSGVFFREFNLPEPDLHLGVGSGSQSKQTATIMVKVEEVIEKQSPDVVLSLGDTNSVLGTALASVKAEVPFVHVEAGLRSYDFSMPEEINRRVADHVASLNMAPTERASINLVEEGISPSKVFLTGNTIVDAVRRMAPLINKSNILTELELSEGDPILLITVHRKENVDREYRLRGIVEAIKKLDEFLVIWPVHPRTNRALKAYKMLDDLLSLNHVILTEPLSYIDFLKLLSSSQVVATDSGGIQEEAVTLKVPCVILRNNTERPEVIELGIGRIAGTSPSNVVAAVRDFFYREELRVRVKKSPNPFGDGTASIRIVKILEEFDFTRSFDSPRYEEGSPTYYAFVVSGKLQEYTVASLMEDFRVEVVSIYDSLGMPYSFDLSTPLIKGYKVRVRGEKSAVNKLRKLVRG